MAGSWDALVVGGGHNGLVAAAYLARAGARPLVLEARSVAGGAATTEAPWPEAPEFKVTRLSYVVSLIPPTIVHDLDLARHGYKVHPMGPSYQAWPDGRSLVIDEDDPRRSHDNVARFSRADADALPRWEAWLAGLADVLGPLLMRPPPKIGSTRPAELLDQLRLAWRYRGIGVNTIGDVTRLLTMSISDLLGEWFTSDEVKAGLAVNGIIGTWAGPDAPGTAYVMAHHSIGDVGDGGHVGSWGYPEGGMGGVARAMRRSAEALGAEIRTDAPVERVLVSGGRAVGVVLRSGEELHAPVVVTTVHPQIAFLRHLDATELPEDFSAAIRRWRSRSGVVKINLALAELPDFTADPGTNQQVHHTGSIELAQSLDHLEQAFQDARAGHGSVRPFSDGCIPSVFDRTLCPEGTHVMSLFAQWCPHEWSQAPHTAELEAFADRVIDGYNELAPNFKGAILHRDVVGPYQMEQEYGLVGGNIFHGELSVDQLLHMRPAPGWADYRTPVAGLYQASSATHGGGGVTGIPGHHAVKAIQADRRRGRVRRLR
jgi:phytoene dehydrogenase-like protein